MPPTGPDRKYRARAPHGATAAERGKPRDAAGGRKRGKTVFNKKKKKVQK